MHLFSSFSRAATLLLVAGMGSARLAAAAGDPPPLGVVEVDLAFPRNQTYAPSKYLPIVFAVQNPAPAAALNMYIRYQVWDRSNMSSVVAGATFDLIWSNFSGAGPFLQYIYHDGFNTEGHWFLVWHVNWVNCTVGQSTFDYEEDDVRLGWPHANRGIDFTTSNSAPEFDLTAATDNKDCPEDLGVTIEVTETLKVPSYVPNWQGRETCAVVGASTPTPDPCQVKIGPSAASSMAASLTARMCNLGGPGAEDFDCPPKDIKSAAHQLAVGGVACLAAAIGASGYLMMIM